MDVSKLFYGARASFVVLGHGALGNHANETADYDDQVCRWLKGRLFHMPIHGLLKQWFTFGFSNAILRASVLSGMESAYEFGDAALDSGIQGMS
jgi:hypothetical protein